MSIISKFTEFFSTNTKENTRQLAKTDSIVHTHFTTYPNTLIHGNNDNRSQPRTDCRICVKDAQGNELLYIEKRINLKEIVTCDEVTKIVTLFNVEPQNVKHIRDETYEK